MGVGRRKTPTAPPARLRYERAGLGSHRPRPLETTRARTGRPGTRQFGPRPGTGKLGPGDVADLAALVGGLELERFGLVGHALGAVTALRYCALHPERVERLVLLDAGPDFPAVDAQRRPPVPEPTPPTRDFASVRAYADALTVLHPRARPERLIELAPHCLRRRADGRFEPKLDPRLLQPRPRGADPTSAAHEREARRLWSELEQIRCPILIVRGEHSTVLSEETAQRMLTVSHDARRVELVGAGHAIVLDAPRALGAALRDFLT